MPPLRNRGEDILLLFRLFALQMAEKYNLPKITLSDEAKAVMMKYKWPGNVRQLKNITEQMSVLSEERVISGEAIHRFIPEDAESTQLAMVNHQSNNHSFESERELLYKILYELRGNVSDLRRDMNELKKQLDAKGSHQPSVSKDMMPSIYTGQRNDVCEHPRISPVVQDAVAEEISEAIYAEPLQTESQHHEARGVEPLNIDSLNLENLSRQMIEKALERNGGNRKKAAQELGISDRTLYRKIKQLKIK